MITLKIKLYQDSAGALHAEFLDGINSVSQNNVGKNVVEVIPTGFELQTEGIVQIAYATSLNENDPITESIGFNFMEKNYERNSWLSKIDEIVLDRRGAWYVALRIVTLTDGIIQTVSNETEPLEFTVNATIQDKNGKYPTKIDVSALYQTAVNSIAESEKKAEELVKKALEDEKGTPNGVASLNEQGKVPNEQLPLLNYLPLTGGDVSGRIYGPGFTAYEPHSGSTSYLGDKISSLYGDLSFPSSLFDHNNKGTIALEEDLLPVKEKVAVISKAIAQSGLIYTADDTATWSERTTAGGKSVLDGAKAVLKKVIGSTVTCNNLLDVSAIPISAPSPTLCWISSIKDNVIEIKSPSGYSGNGYAPTNKKLSELCPSLKAGDTVYAYFDTTGVPQIYLPSLGTWSSGSSKTITAATLSENLVLYGATTGDTTVNLINLRITKVKDAPWQAYFTGTKSAEFGGLDSVNKSGTQTSAINFPTIDTPSGTIIDFENITITVNGVTTEMTPQQLTDLDFVTDENGNILGVAYDAYKQGKERVRNSNGIYLANNTLVVNYVYITGVK